MKSALVRVLFCFSVVALVAQSGCSSPPPPRTSYQDPITSIRLYVDDRADAVHSHPAQVTVGQMTQVLNGIRVVPRKGFIGSLITGETQANPAFSSTEVKVLAPGLSRALGEATPQELVTFYRRFSDASVGLAITSGGMFVQENQLLVVLANNRNLPTEGMNQNMVADFDPVDSPLIPISRTSFRVEFTPPMAVVPKDQRWDWHYIDEGRILAIDLQQLNHDMESAPAASKP
ncbi:MAG: uncharacterized protein K0S45_3371 [Nitrospira sp.]|jgi:hypothetical protein|nr:uncharacterized protein [Nitrospira sp.]